MSDNGAMKTRRPQLADSISKLDEMVDGLATAIPGAVADSVREALGAAFADGLRQAIRDAAKDAMRDALKEAMSEMTGNPTTPTAPGPPPPAPPARRVGAWARVKAVLGRLRRWAGRKAAPTASRLLVGWAVVKLVGGSTVRSRTATLATLMSGVLSGLVGYAAGPVASAVLLGLMSGTIAALAVWAGPAIGLLAVVREEWPGGGA